MTRHFFVVILSFLTSSFAGARESDFAHFLEPGFPFCEITVDARALGKEFPKDNLIPRGLVVRVAEDTYLAYDTDLCRLAVAWTGGFLTEESLATMSYHQAKKKKSGGQKKLPTPIGNPISASGLYPGVQFGMAPKFNDPRPAGKEPKEIGRGALPKGMVKWVSGTAIGDQVKLHYEIGEVKIREVPSAVDDTVIVRHFQVNEHPKNQLTIVIGTGHCQLINPPSGSTIKQEGGISCLTLDRADSTQEFAIAQSAKKLNRKISAPIKMNAASDHWPKLTKTKGKLAADTADYVIDTIPLPMDNPERRNVRPIDIDFADDYAVVVTFDGDLWKVRGLQGDLQKITWKRIACGLQEPSAVQIKDGEIFVFGRNGITKVFSGKEGLVYENHSSDFWQSAETRDFAHSLSVDHKGHFYFSKGGQQNDYPSKHSGRVLKLDDDNKVSIFASGLRNTYLTIRPGTDEIYASDQQGHWVPATPIHRIVKGGYYGFQPAAPSDVPEPKITPPLCWIPHTVAGSGLGLVWADQKRFGPLSDSLIYLDFRRPGLLRTYLNQRDGQAASVPMPGTFDFPLLKGAVNPADGQLYLVGFQIWGSNSNGIRGMARLRYTGKPSLLPTRVIAGKNAVVLTFDQELDPAIGKITIRRWNYQRSDKYGSGHYRPDGKSGEEFLPVSAPQFSADHRSVLLATPDLDPVHQLAVSYELKSASGQSFSNAAYLTLHHTSPLDLKKEGFSRLDLAKLAANAKDQQPSPHKIKPTIERGAKVYLAIGCAACHSVDGSSNGRSGPTWKGLAGSKRKLITGESVEVTTKYLRESILDPTAKVAKGYNPRDVGMPSYRGILSDSDIESLIFYIQSLKK